MVAIREVVSAPWGPGKANRGGRGVACGRRQIRNPNVETRNKLEIKNLKPRTGRERTWAGGTLPGANMASEEVGGDIRPFGAAGLLLMGGVGS